MEKKKIKKIKEKKGGKWDLGIELKSGLCGMESGIMNWNPNFVECRFRLRSAFDPFSIASEAFSEHNCFDAIFTRIPMPLEINQ